MNGASNEKVGDFALVAKADPVTFEEAFLDQKWRIAIDKKLLHLNKTKQRRLLILRRIRNLL